MFTNCVRLYAYARYNTKQSLAPHIADFKKNELRAKIVDCITAVAILALFFLNDQFNIDLSTNLIYGIACFSGAVLIMHVLAHQAKYQWLSKNLYKDPVQTKHHAEKHQSNCRTNQNIVLVSFIITVLVVGLLVFGMYAYKYPVFGILPEDALKMITGPTIVISLATIFYFIIKHFIEHPAQVDSPDGEPIAPDKKSILPSNVDSKDGEPSASNIRSIKSDDSVSE